MESQFDKNGCQDVYIRKSKNGTKPTDWSNNSCVNPQGLLPILLSDPCISVGSWLPFGTVSASLPLMDKRMDIWSERAAHADYLTTPRPHTTPENGKKALSLFSHEQN